MTAHAAPQQADPPREYATPLPSVADIPLPAALLAAGQHPAARHATGTEARVCADIGRRQALGVHKYGRTVEDNPLPLRRWLWHAYEEALDLAIYLRRAIEQLDRDDADRSQPANCVHPTREAP